MDTLSCLKIEGKILLLWVFLACISLPFHLEDISPTSYIRKVLYCFCAKARHLKQFTFLRVNSITLHSSYYMCFQETFVKCGEVGLNDKSLHIKKSSVSFFTLEYVSFNFQKINVPASCKMCVCVNLFYDLI